MPDLETLRIIWWLLLGLLFIGFAITDGYDFGVGILYPFVARNDTERSIVLNTVRPFWEGNQVWIILGAGAVFAAWPFVYAVAFSGAYFAVLLLLLTMGISRPVTFKYRSKIKNATWLSFWDVWVFIGGFMPALLFGMLVGNIIVGLPFSFDNELRIAYTGTFWQLFNPFALWCGITSVMMLTMHGGVYLAIKTENPIAKRALLWAKTAALLLIIFFALGGVMIAYGVTGYHLSAPVDHFGYSNPLNKAVGSGVGDWLRNYSIYPTCMLAPLCGFAGAFLVLFSRGWLAFIASCLAMTGIITTFGVSLYPFILPSSSHFNSSLLIWDASSTELTLLLMLIASIIFLPLIIIYTSWVHYALRGKVTASAIEAEKKQHVY